MKCRAASFCVIAVALSASLQMGFICTAETVWVSNLSDSGPGSLRKAIELANPGDTVTFSVTGTIVLTSGQLTISKNLTLSGPGPESLAISGNGSSRVFEIDAALVSISGLAIEDGSAVDGAGVLSSGTLSLQDVAVRNNNASNNGGGVASEVGVLTLGNCTISGNTAEKNGGGLVCNDTTLTDCMLSGNTATGSVYWGGWGGGIAVVVGGTVKISGTTISGNSAAASGGGICSSGSTLLLESCTISENDAGVSGGGICNRVGAVMSADGCTIAGNTAEKNGGGVYTSPDENHVEMTNCTLSGNTATGSVYLGGHGGGIGNSVSSFCSLLNCTITENTALFGGGVTSGEPLILKNTIVSGNSAGTDPSFNGSGSLLSYGYNLIESNDSCPHNEVESSGTDIVGEDPLLGQLADNGGHTHTHALLPGSPAIDAAACTSVEGATITVDQRGTSRPKGSQCDIGAFESSPTFTLTVVVEGSGAVASTPVGIACSSTCVGCFGNGAVVALTAIPALGSTFVGWGGDCSGTDLSMDVLIDANKTCVATFGLPNSCPSACFTHSPESPTTEGMISFADCSDDTAGEITEWSWTFGDGETALERNPTHWYASAGTYTVVLTVTDNDGAIATASEEIIVITRWDVNCDGKTDLLDVRIILQTVAGFASLSPSQEAEADVDGDGRITQADAEMLARFLIHMGEG